MAAAAALPVLLLLRLLLRKRVVMQCSIMEGYIRIYFLLFPLDIVRYCQIQIAFEQHPIPWNEGLGPSRSGNKNKN